MSSYYNIVKVLNNSSLLVTDGYNESIIIGTGIGFKRKPGESLDGSVVFEKEYHLLKGEDFLSQSSMPKDIIRHTAEIVNIIYNYANREAPIQSTFSLSNHIAAMLVRIEKDEIFSNPFHYETVALYPDSYGVAEQVSVEVKNRTGIVLPESEIDFLTLYIHGIRSDFDKLNISIRNAIINDISELVEEKLGNHIDKSSGFYARFITHIKFLLQRLSKNEPLPKIPMMQKFAEQYPEYMEISAEIAMIISGYMKMDLNQEEHLYISLHLARLSLLEYE